jgi:outer membrane protein TolC
MATLVKQREVQEATVRSARGGYGPTLSAAAGATEAGTKIDSLVPNWSAGLLLNWPIFQGGLTQGQIRQAEAALASVHAQQSIEQLQVRLDVDTARLGVLQRPRSARPRTRSKTRERSSGWQSNVTRRGSGTSSSSPTRRQRPTRPLRRW